MNICTRWPRNREDDTIGAIQFETSRRLFPRSLMNCVGSTASVTPQRQWVNLVSVERSKSELVSQAWSLRPATVMSTRRSQPPTKPGIVSSLVELVRKTNISPGLADGSPSIPQYYFTQNHQVCLSYLWTRCWHLMSHCV